MRLENQVAIVTGAGYGLGRAIAIGLAEEGADVVVSDINPETARKVAGEIKALGRRVLDFKVDVNSSREVNGMVEATLREFGKVDILVNNAGGSAREKCTEFRESAEDTWQFVIGRNLMGTLICCRAVVNHMIERKWGKIINIASVAGVLAEAGQADYSASKGGVIAFTKALARELGRYGINVNAVSPGIIFGTAASENVPADITEHALSKQCLKRSDGRRGEPRDVANAVVFLASEESSFITGGNILVSGGLGA